MDVITCSGHRAKICHIQNLMTKIFQYVSPIGLRVCIKPIYILQRKYIRDWMSEGGIWSRDKWSYFTLLWKAITCQCPRYKTMVHASLSSFMHTKTSYKLLYEIPPDITLPKLWFYTSISELSYYSGQQTCDLSLLRFHRGRQLILLVPMANNCNDISLFRRWMILSIHLIRNPCHRHVNGCLSEILKAIHNEIA